MVSQADDYFRPLCPTHHEAMISDTTDIHGRECPVDGCKEKYSPSFGHFTLRRNDDYWNVTHSSSFRIAKNSTQVICGDHKVAMFIESFDAANTNLADCRCPQKGCPQIMKTLAGGPPAYWLGSGYFGMR